MRICKDCVFYVAKVKICDGFFFFDVCTHPEASTVNRITGKATIGLCDEFRGLHGKCGAEGKMFSEGTSPLAALLAGAK